MTSVCDELTHSASSYSEPGRGLLIITITVIIVIIIIISIYSTRDKVL